MSTAFGGGPPCRRRRPNGQPCGHARHGHLRGGACTVKIVSGPPSTAGHIAFDSSQISEINPKGEVYVHEGRTVEDCGCPGFLE